MNRCGTSLLSALWIQGIAALLLVSAKSGYCSSVSLPIEVTEPPAVDLLYQGEPIGRDEAINLASQGVDISTLDPIPNDVWSPDSNLPAVQETQELNYPENGATVSFDSKLPSSQGMMRSRIVSDDSGSSLQFQMILSLSAHASLARNALLRRLGYPIPSPRYYSSLKVRFKNLESRDAFLDDVSDATLTARTRWIRNLPTDLPEVTLQDVVLEPAQIDVPMYHWGAIPASHIKGRRAIRALVVPLVFLDILESVNIFSYELGKVLNESVILTCSYAENFAEATFQDAAWIARKIAALSRTDLEEIVRAGQYPPDITALILEKVISRRNHLVEIFNLSRSLFKSQRVLPFNNQISIGNVKNGKLTVGTYDGYAARFTYGDPDSPLRPKEVAKYLFMNSITAGLATLASQVNKQMQIQSTSDLGNQNQANLIQSAMDWARDHPGVPYSQTLSTWGGPYGGFGVSGTRSVITGNYYGSNAKVQVVDSMSISAAAGYFLGVNGVPHVLPSLNGNLTVQRNYLHVRPIAEMNGALKANWAYLFVPTYLNHLATILDEPKPEASEPENDRMSKFLDTLKENEMLMVIDSVQMGAIAQIRIPIPVLMDPTVAVFNPSVGLAVGSTPTILRRTTFIRTAEGIQVYIQNSKILNIEVELNFNWWMNVLRISHENRRAWGDTRAYLLDRGIIKSEEERRKLIISLKCLLRRNDSEVLAENFKEHKIHHELNLGINKAKFLWWKAYTIDEDHRVRVSLPNYPNNVRTLFSNRKVDNRGVSPYSFFSDIVSAATQGVAQLPLNMGWNPAMTPLGYSHWVNISTEAETTPSYKPNPVSLIENHFGGWFLSKKSLMKTLDQLEAKVKPLNLEKSIIRRDEFNTVDHLEFYNIFSSLIIYEEGINQISKALFKPKLSEVVQELISIEGRENLKRWCAQADRKAADTLLGVNSYSGRENNRTIRYKCIKPWMKKVLKVRNKVIQSTYPDTTEARVRWQNRLIQILEKHLELPKFLSWLGKDNFFFQIRVSGYRAKDENGDTDYISDSIGNLKEKEGVGAFRDFAAKYGIMNYELYARYLAEGYQGI